MDIAFISNKTQKAEELRIRLEKRYGYFPVESADIVVALGGDGLMLRTAHKLMGSEKPLYGMHCGSVGFLMNKLKEDDLKTRLENAEHSKIHPLVMESRDRYGKTLTARAINEVSMLRKTYQATKLRITVNGRVRMEELICDGILVATPAGSTAYNLSARGTILPINSPLLAMTPLNPFRPRRWHGALLSNKADIRIDVLEPTNRPVIAAVDHNEVHHIVHARIHEDQNTSVTLLFDPEHNLDERILQEQFVY